MERGRGHRALAHTADVILEAWGPDLASCCEEAVAALAGTYVEAGAPTVERRRSEVPPGAPDAQLLAVLDEVIFTLDTSATVPVGAEVTVSHDGGLDLVLLLADRHAVTPTGAVPKAVSRSELAVESRPSAVRCRFLIDL